MAGTTGVPLRNPGGEKTAGSWISGSSFSSGMLVGPSDVSICSSAIVGSNVPDVMRSFSFIGEDPELVGVGGGFRKSIRGKSTALGKSGTDCALPLGDTSGE